ncbi:MAG: (d)CMP kinase [Gammaproteobacteria bacterium]|nr:(d)CMP kinase [Gammaproteobacteria bacterium]MDX2486959.1 (d)CMP kinase [Gammaproteobacteria bacterium]
MTDIPVITIDGPSGSGKGTVSQQLASSLGWHYLDSGAIYRALAYAVDQLSLNVDDNKQRIVDLARELKLCFRPSKDGGAEVLLDNINISAFIRTEECGAVASTLAAEAGIRAALLQRQRDFRQLPGLVADGRDMGTVVFPDATHKIFLTASAQVRAERRYQQLKENGINDSIPRLFTVISERDARDAGRSNSPLTPATDAIVLDTSNMNLEQVMGQIRQQVGYQGL